MRSDQSLIIDQFLNARVLCVGDVMLDSFIYGQIDRISPEAPIPVFSIRSENSMLGGAGNVVCNLTALGGFVTFVSVIGDDAVGRSIVSMLAKEANLTPYLITETGRISTLKTRYVAGTQQVLRADKEVLHPFSTSTVARVMDAIISALPQQDVVLLSDYGKGIFTREAVGAIIQAAKDHKKPVLVDPKSRDFGLYAGATCLCPNLRELENAAGRELRTEEDILAEAHRLMKNHDIERILVTRSKDGMTLVSQNDAPYHISALKREVFDVSGAGDTACATLSLGVAVGAPWQEAVALANMAAGIAVGRLGTAIVTRQDLKNALFTQAQDSGAYKIVPLAAAASQTEQWKREGKTIGFTNGCFDLMHSGHLTLLHQAKAQCDRLVVGVNADASVKRLKGESRPLNGEMERAMLLASLTCVDQVIIFEEDTPLALIKALKPGIIFKGSDYQKHQVVGHDVVESYGGTVVLVALKEGYSTTNIIRKMA